MMKRRFSHYRWVTLISFAVMYNFVYLGRFNVNNNMERFVADVGMNDVQTYILSVSIFLSYAAGSVFNGYLADRVGAKRIVVCGGLGTILMNVFISMEHVWGLLLGTWIINGFFQSMIWVGGYQHVVSLVGRMLEGTGDRYCKFLFGDLTCYSIPLTYYASVAMATY